MDRLTVSDEDGHSVFSGLSLLDNDTDDFGRKLLQHTRDAQRITNVINSHHGQAFRRARPLPRDALTLDNLQRNTLANDERSASDGALTQTPPSVASSVASDPPLNVPREWGRKGRQNNTWLRRIKQEDRETKARDGIATHENQPSFDGDSSMAVDWMAAANQPLDSVEQDSSPLRSRHTTPASARPQNNSLDQIREWESDQDLTAASLLASTPALPSRNRGALDDIRQREIQAVGERALTSSRRSIWERTPSETRRRAAGDSPGDAAVGQPPTASVQSRPASVSGTRQFPRRRSLLGNKENIPLGSSRQDGTAYSISKSLESIGVVDTGIQASVQRNPQRPQYSKRTDSMALLKRLARVSSSTPSPPSAKQPPDTDSKPMANDVLDNAASVQAATANDQSPQAASNQEERQQERSRRSTEMARHELHAQTPIVTGAWVDTPRTERPRSQASQNTITAIPTDANLPPTYSEAIVPRRRSEPNLPKSALAAVLEDLRNSDRHDNNHTDNDPTLGDSTIASLEDMMNPSTSGEDPTVTLNIPDSILHSSHEDDNLDIDTRPTTQADRDRRQEDLALEALNNKLNSADSAIKDASRGLRKAASTRHHLHDTSMIDASVIDAVGPSASSGSSFKSSSTTTSSPRHLCDGHCSTCGRHTSVLKSALYEYLGLYFYQEDSSTTSTRHNITTTRRPKTKPKYWGLRLTSLGLISLIFWSWLATETALCSLYCHPTYAAKMEGYGVDPDAPRFPYVIPTLVFRPVRWIWRPLLTLLLWALGGIWRFVFESDGASYSASTRRSPSASASASSSSSFLGGSGLGGWFSSSSSSSSGKGGSDSVAGAGQAKKISWFRRKNVGEAWSDGHEQGQNQGKVQRMNIWDKGQRAWEADGDGYGIGGGGGGGGARDYWGERVQEVLAVGEDVEDGESESMLEDDYV